MMNNRRKPVKITDTTLRDGHQSLWATRMRTEDILPIAAEVDKVGYHSVEVWGGATFDVCLRYLNEDPWIRLKKMKEKMPRTPLQMLLRGQNIVGYKNYPDDVLEAFIKKSLEHGINIFRIFDALNDIRNVEKAIEFVVKHGGRAQGAICYTRSPIHTIERYVEYGKKLYSAGATSINIKDMSGILTPYDAFRLVSALKSEVKLPLQLHCHSSSGMATAAYVKAVEAGVDIIDCAAAPLALYTSQPAVETMLAIFRGTERMSRINFNKVHKISEYFEKISEEQQTLQRTKQSMIDVSVIEHQVPGGMASNMIMQLEQQNAIDQFEEVLLEIPKIRKELGWPPLVTPMSQLVGTQAVFNVMSGKRYKIIPREIKDYLGGLYGTPPGEVDPKLMKIAGVKKLDSSIRPADRLEPILPKSEKAMSKKGFKYNDLDVITYSLFPDVAVEFFQKRKEGKDADTVSESTAAFVGSDKLSQLSSICNTLSGTGLAEFVWEGDLGKVTIKRSPVVNQPILETEIATIEAPPAVEQPKDMIRAGMVGVFCFGESMGRGDVIKKGQVIGFIEAMRLKHEVRAEKRCCLIDVLVKDREPVEYDQPIFIIEPC